MPIGEICVRDVVVVDRDTNVHEAAQLMRRHHVGNLVVVEGPLEQRRPVGVITDRDLVISVLATGLDPKVFAAGDIITRDLVTAREDQGIFESMQQMRNNGVRRMPVVDYEGILVGIVSIDDLIQLLAQEMSELSRLIERERAEEVEHKR